VRIGNQGGVIVIVRHPNSAGIKIDYNLPLFNRQFVPTKTKRVHRLHDKPISTAQRRAKRADLQAKGKRKKGDAVSFLRMVICAHLKRSGGGWVELDLVKVANARGYHIRTLRGAFKKLMDDPSFAKIVEERRHQKRLKKNGTFVIIVASQQWLLHDGEPLLRHSDETTRHVRRRLREKDIPEPTRRGSALSRSTILHFSSFGQQDEINKLASAQNQSSVAAGDTSLNLSTHSNARGNEKTNKPEKTFNQASHEQLKTSRNNKKIEWKEGQLLSDSGRKSLNKKVKRTLIQCRGLHWENCKVKFEGKLAWVFIFQAMRNCQPAALIEKAWLYGIKTAHADSVDGLARVPAALALSHSRRYLQQHTTGTIQERADAVYKAQNFKKRNASNDARRLSFSQRYMPQKANSNKHIPPLKEMPPAGGNPNKNDPPPGQTQSSKKPVTPLGSLSKQVDAILAKITPTKFHPEQAQTVGSPGAIGQAAVPKPPLQTPATPKYQPQSPEDEAASKWATNHLHEFLLSLDEEDRRERIAAQAKKDIKKS
jgi:hypothetical protein